MSPHIAFFTEKCWCKKLLEMKCQSSEWFYKNGKWHLNKAQFIWIASKNWKPGHSHINLIHREIWWLGRGRVLHLSVWAERWLVYFGENSKLEFSECLKDKRMSAETSLFSKHLITWGPGENVLTPNSKILEFKKKLNFWKNHVDKENLEMFPLLFGSKGEERYQ